MPVAVAELQQIADRLAAAARPEDVFGEDWGAAQKSHRLLARNSHPDVQPPENRALADATQRKLNVLWGLAVKRHELGLYGTSKRIAEPVTLVSKTGTYSFTGAWASGDVCELYRPDDAPRLIVKIPRLARDSDLMQGEATVLRALRKDAAASEFHPFVPELADSFNANVGGATRTVNVLDALPDLFSLEEVVQQHGPLSDKHMAWVWRRLLKVLGHVDHEGYVHGAVTPAHVLVNEGHALVLTDWCYAVKTKTVLKAVPTPYRAYYPKAVFDKKSVDRKLDMDMGARTMVWLMGGDVATGTLPDTVHPRIRRYFSTWWRFPALALPSPWELNIEFTKLIEDLWGKRQFQPIALSRA